MTSVETTACRCFQLLEGRVHGSWALFVRLEPLWKLEKATTVSKFTHRNPSYVQYDDKLRAYVEV